MNIVRLHYVATWDFQISIAIRYKLHKTLFVPGRSRFSLVEAGRWRAPQANNVATQNLFLFNCCKFANNAKILAIFPYPGPSQYILVQPYLKALAFKSHEMTVINARPHNQ
uniref:Uncharacterized protein n=1 Tax=Glossina austeni TaxID=7395 RepID=A0A1A9VF71_GLOAU